MVLSAVECHTIKQHNVHCVSYINFLTNNFIKLRRKYYYYNNIINFDELQTWFIDCNFMVLQSLCHITVIKIILWHYRSLVKKKKKKKNCMLKN